MLPWHHDTRNGVETTEIEGQSLVLPPDKLILAQLPFRVILPPFCRSPLADFGIRPSPEMLLSARRRQTMKFRFLLQFGWLALAVGLVVVGCDAWKGPEDLAEMPVPNAPALPVAAIG